MSYLDDIGHGQFDAGYGHAVAVTNNNTVITAGSSSYLGAIASQTSVVSVACGYYQSFAVLLDGTVKAYGTESSSVIANCAALTNVKRIFSSKWTNAIIIALHNDGTITGFGFDTYGAATGGNSLTNVAHAAVTRLSGCCAHLDGTVSWWGYDNGYSSSGLDTITDALMVAFVQNALLVLHNDGTLTCHGSSTNTNPVTAQISGVSDAIWIESTRTGAAIALLEGGQVLPISSDGAGLYSGAAQISGAIKIAGGTIPPIVAQFPNGSLAGFGDDLSSTKAGISAWADVPLSEATYQLSGVTALVEGEPVSAMIRVYKDDSGKLLYNTTSSPVDGSWSVIMPRRWSAYVMAIYDNGYQPQVHGPIAPPPEV